MELLLNILNYLFIVSVLLFFLYLKKINLLLFLILSASGFSVFFVTKLVSVGKMPDVMLYTYIAEKVRSLEFNFHESNLRVFTGPLPYTKENFVFDPSFNAAFLMTAIPIPFITNFISLGFSNKLIYFLTFVFLHTKKAFNKVSFTMFLFYPSIVMYTSVGLKDTLVLVLSCLSGYFLIQKKYFYLILFLSILATFKYTNASLIIIASIVYFVLFIIENIKLKQIIIILGITIMFIFCINFGYKIFDILDLIREGQWYADGKKIPQELAFNRILFIETIDGLLRFYFRPTIFEVKNNLQLFQTMENIFVLGILILTFISCFKIDKNRALFWLSSLIFMSIIYGLTVSNFGTLTRYRFPLVMFYIFVSFYDCNSYVQKKKKIIIHN